MKFIRFLPIVILLFVSCKTILINSMIKDPKVENTESIKNFLEGNGFSVKNALILKADSTNIEAQLVKGLVTDYYIFDKNGRHLCYNGSATCKGSQFLQLIENKTDNFGFCKNDSINLSEVLSQTYTLSNKAVDMTSFNESEYFIVSYWQKFMGGKKGYEDAIVWMQDQAKDSAKYTIININTDLQESWGLEPNAKARMKIQKGKKGKYILTLDEIPFKL